MTIYYVDNVLGSNVNAGTSEGSGNAWETPEYAAGQVAAGDHVYIKANSGYTAQDGANNSILNIETPGTAGSPILWEGYTTSPGDGGKAVFNAGTNTLANCVNGAIAAWYNIFKHFRFTGGSANGVDVNGAVGDYAIFYDCKVDNNGGWGIQGDNGIATIKCEIHDNTSGGVDADYPHVALFNTVYDNSGIGISCGVGGVLTAISNVCYGNSGAQIHTFNDSSYASVILNNSVDGNDTAGTIGIHSDNASGFMFICMNNIVMDCATGIQNDATQVLAVPNINFNMLVSNTTDYTGVVAGDDDIDTNTDPFTASATRDYSLATGSAAIDAGEDAS